MISSRKLYSDLDSSIETRKIEYDNEIGVYTKKSDKMIKILIISDIWKGWWIRINYFTRKKNESLSNWNILKMKFLITVEIFFNIFPRTGNLLSRPISKTKSTNKVDFIFC